MPPPAVVMVMANGDGGGRTSVVATRVHMHARAHTRGCEKGGGEEKDARASIGIPV